MLKAFFFVTVSFWIPSDHEAYLDTKLDPIRK